MSTNLTEKQRRRAGDPTRAPLRRRPPGIPIPSQCRELIDRGALVSLAHSGGKDS